MDVAQPPSLFRVFSVSLHLAEVGLMTWRMSLFVIVVCFAGCAAIRSFSLVPVNVLRKAFRDNSSSASTQARQRPIHRNGVMAFSVIFFLRYNLNSRLSRVAVHRSQHFLRYCRFRERAIIFLIRVPVST